MKHYIIGTGLFVLFLFSSTYSLLYSDESSQTIGKKAAITFRIGVNIWSNDARFEQLLDLFDKYPGATDEITFFTQATHSPIPDDELVKRCVLLKDRIAVCKKRGYRAGINILCTLGHHSEDIPNSIGQECPRGITIDGKTAEGTLCMNQEIFRERIRRIYAALTEADPDYIWIDDDVRVGHMLNSTGEAGSICYCEYCLKLMSEKFNQEISRDYLLAHINEQEIRAKIHQFNSDSIDKLFVLIEEVVHEKSPCLPLGFMTGERYEEGYDFDRWAKTLAGPNQDQPVYWRPGGGFYDHSSIYSLVGKAHDIGRQISLLPSQVEMIQSEIENFPYQPLEKAKNVTALEAAVYIATGCTGAAFNVLTMNEEPLDDYEPMIRTASQWRPFYDLLVQHLGRQPLVGVHPLWERTDADYLLRVPSQHLTLGVSEAGIPVAYAKGKSNVFLVSRAFVSQKSRDEIQNYFKEGIYTDNDALGLLNDPQSYALNDLTGMEYGGIISVDGIEKYQDHFLNGTFGGRTRDKRQSFWREPMFCLNKTQPGVETLSSAVDYSLKETAETILGVFENRLGGRVCVNGYYPWSYFYSRPKQTQIRNIMRWLSKDRLPAYIESFDRVNLWVREPDESGKTAMVALNATFDSAENMVVMIRTTSDFITFYDRSCKPVIVQADSVDGPYRRFVVPEINPWECILILCENASF